MSEKKCIVSVEMRTIIDTIYPVGSYFWSSKNKNPSNFLGGTWEKVKDKFLLAAGDSYAVGSTGGEAQHTLTIDEIPSHNHKIKLFTGNNGIGTTTDDTKQGKPLSSKYNENGALSSNTNIEQPIGMAGGGSPHNNMPPYITAHCWHRTA